MPVCGGSLYAGKLGHRRGGKIRQEASFDHDATSDTFEICAMTFHVFLSIWGRPMRPGDFSPRNLDHSVDHSMRRAHLRVNQATPEQIGARGGSMTET